MTVRTWAMPQGALTLAMLIFGIDQISKTVVLGFYDSNTWPITVTPFFNLVLVWNEGVSFGLLGGGSELQRWALTALAFGVAAGLFVWAGYTKESAQSLAFPLIAAGAVGNGIDRILHGAVVDFLDFHVAGWHWPAFNVADSAIVFGAAVLLFDGLWPRGRPHT